MILDLAFTIYIFILGFMFGLIISKIYKNFSLRVISFKNFKLKFFHNKLCHCGLTKTPPYCDKSHPFAFRCFRWWRWINENLNENDKGL